MRRALLLALMLIPAAQAGHDAEVRFLSDGAYGPAGDGQLLMMAPEGEDASLRQVLAADADYQMARFLEPAGEEHPAQMEGSLFVGLWLDQVPAAAGLMDVAVLRVSAAGMEELATAQVAFGGDAPAAPAPESLVPSDPDPEAAAWQAMAQAYPYITAPPILADMGQVDVELAEGERVAVAFKIADGSQAPAAALKFGSILAPTFAYIPWHSPAAPPSASSPAPAPAPAPAPVPAPAPAPGEAPTQESPAPLALLALAAVALALRRR